MTKTKEERYAVTEAYSNTLPGRLNKIKINARGSAKKRGHTCELEYYDIRDLWAKQNGLCAYTGWPMELTTKSQRLVSLERIDNNKSYTKDNILLVCWCANKARSGMTQNEFISMCKAIGNHSQLD